MKIRNDDRQAYREGRFQDVDPDALAFLEAQEKAKPDLKPVKEEKKEADKDK